jgi:peptidoglycan hydrolase-like amidase
MKKFNIFKFFVFFLFSLTVTCSHGISLFKIPAVSESLRLVIIKVPFNGSNTELGVSKLGYIQDAKSKIPLQPYAKYRIKFNSKSGFNLFLISNNQELPKGQIALPFRIQADSAEPKVFFDGRWYHGSFEIQSSKTGIISLNELDIEDLLASLIGKDAAPNTSVQAIKAASVILRSSILSYTVTNKGKYHLNASDLSYQGLQDEQAEINPLIQSTSGEVLYNNGGNVLYTPIRIATSSQSLPYELIGKKTRAWEKVMSLPEVESQLRAAGYNIGQIYSIQSSFPQSQIDLYAHEDGAVLSIESQGGSTQLSLTKAKEVFSLPSPNFRVYSFAREVKSKRNLQGITNPMLRAALKNSTEKPATENYIQFIGSILASSYTQRIKPDNLLLSIMQFEKNNSDYKKLLKQMYPESYLGRL